MHNQNKLIYAAFLIVCSFLFLVMPFCSEVSAKYIIQRGVTEITSNQQDISIAPVRDMKRAFVLISKGTGYQNNNTNANIIAVRAELQAVDTIRAYRTTNNNSSTISWQVVECTEKEFKVFRGSGSFASGAGDTSEPIGATVTPANCMAWVSADNDQSDRNDCAGHELTAYVNAATTVRIQRDYTTDATANYNWQVIEFDPAQIGSIETGETTITTQQEGAPSTQAINPVNLNTSILLFQHRTNYNGITYAAVAGRFENNAQISFYKHTNYNHTMIARWYVIDFGGTEAIAQRGQVDNSGNSNWQDEYITIPIPVNRNSTLVFHSMTCSGTQTGSAYPRPYATNFLPRPDVLQIKRFFIGQPSYIEWQLIELPSEENVVVHGGINIHGKTRVR